MHDISIRMISPLYDSLHLHVLLAVVSEGTAHELSVGPQVRLRAAVEDFINEGAEPAERMIRDLVDCEHAYINTDHPQFIGGNRALSQVTLLLLLLDFQATSFMLPL